MDREEAIEIIRKNMPSDKSLPVYEALQALIPELAESEDERIRKTLLEYFNERNSYRDEDETFNGVPFSSIIACLEKQKEQSWMPTEEEMGVLYKLCYVSTQISDDDDTELTRLYQDLKREYFNGRSFENMFPKAEKEQKPIKMEVYEVGKGTTICGQDYKCKKDYKEGNCWYIKDVVYHCSRDGYLTDQNGISWSCTPEWFKEYIQSNTEWAEEEKIHFVSGQFLQCKLSFDGFKEGEHYWLEYVGNDMYVGRSDNILNQKFHITPRQLFTLFSQELEEVQGPPQEEKQVSLNYEPPFDENPSDKEIVEALIKHLKEQDGFLTAIDSVSTKAILSWLEKQKEQKVDIDKLRRDIYQSGYNDGYQHGKEDAQKEQKPAEKPINWTELTWKDINELEGIINNVHYDFCNGIGQESFGKEVLERFREYKGDEYLDEIEQKSVDYDAELKKCKDNPLYFFDKYVSIKLKPAKWSEEDWKLLDEMREHIIGVMGDKPDLTPNKIYDGFLDLIDRLKFAKPQLKQEWSKEDKDVIDEAAELALGWGCPNLSAKLKSILSRVKPAEWSDYKDKVNVPYCSSEPEWNEEDKNKIERLAFLVSVVEEKEMISPSESIDLRNFIKSLRPQQKQEWSEEDKGFLLDVKCVIDEVLHSTSDINTGYTKEELKEMWQWLDGIWQRVEYPEDKAEWDEKDKETLSNILYILDQLKDTTVHKEDKTAEKCISWLKSLRPSWKPSAQELGALKTAVSVLTEERTFPKAAEQIQKIIDVFDGKELRKDWKPSEEQMEELNKARRFIPYNCDILESLYEQLKEL